jgi:hypothetical protein
MAAGDFAFTRDSKKNLVVGAFAFDLWATDRERILFEFCGGFPGRFLLKGFWAGSQRRAARYPC